MCIFTKIALFAVSHIRQHFYPTYFGAPLKSTKLGANFVDFKISKVFFWRSLYLRNVRTAKCEKKHVHTQYFLFVAVYAQG